MQIVLLINITIISLVFWCRNKSTSYTIIEDVIILEIGSTVFNMLVGLILLFDFMENHPTELFKNLFADQSAFTWLLTCIGFSIIHFFFAFLFFRKKLSLGKKIKR